MASWVSLLRTVVPELAKIVSAGAPAFAARQGLSQQIAELQQAVSNNAASVKAVAEKSQHIANAVDELVAENQAHTDATRAAAAQFAQITKQARQTRLLAVGALVTATIALIVAVVVAVLQ